MQEECRIYAAFRVSQLTKTSFGWEEKEGWKG